MNCTCPVLYPFNAASLPYFDGLKESQAHAGLLKCRDCPYSALCIIFTLSPSYRILHMQHGTMNKAKMAYLCAISGLAEGSRECMAE